MSCSSHDVANLEKMDVLSVFVAADAFVRAARSQAATLPVEPGRVYVPSPIADRTDEEISVITDGAYEPIVGLLTAPESGSREIFTEGTEARQLKLLPSAVTTRFS